MNKKDFKLPRPSSFPRLSTDPKRDSLFPKIKTDPKTIEIDSEWIIDEQELDEAELDDEPAERL